MIPAGETFGGTFPFKPRFSTAAGFRMHYVDEGSGQPIVCLHGEPTWGYLYRKLIPRLASRWRVIVPDHMGFGKSETPQDREYTLAAHVGNLTALIEELGLEGVTFVGQDWGGPMLAAYTVRHPRRVRRVFLANGLCGYGAAVAPRGAPRPPKLTGSEWFRWVSAALKDGSYHTTMRDLGRHVKAIMERLGCERGLDEAAARAYAAPFSTPAECKGAVEFPLDAVLGRIRDYVIEGLPGIPALRSKPAMLAEGMCDRAIPPELAIADFRALFPEGPVTEIPGAGHFCQEDAPERLSRLIARFMRETPAS